MKRIPLLVCCLVLAAGCTTVGPDYVRETPPLPDAWSLALLDRDATARSDGDFWQTFGDPQLTALLARAERDSRNLREAEARIAEVRAQRRIVAAAALPQVDANSSVIRDRVSDAGRFSFKGLANPATTYSASIDLRWELDLFGGTARRIEAAEAQVAATRWRRDALAISLAAEVALNYFELRAAQEKTQCLDRQIDAARAALDLTRARVRAGLNSEVDQWRAEDEFAKLQARRPLVVGDAAVAVRRLGVLVGGQSADLVAELSAPLPLPQGSPSLPQHLPAALLDRRPDLAAAEAEVIAANAGIGAAEAERLPALGLAATLGSLSITGGNFLGASGALWSLGPQLRLPLYRGGALDAAVDAARARREAAAVRWEQAASEAILEVETAAIRLREADERHAALTRGVSAQREVMGLARIRYERGLADFSLPLDALRQLAAGETEEVDARLRRLSEMVLLFKALGGGWRS